MHIKLRNEDLAAAVEFSGRCSKAGDTVGRGELRGGRNPAGQVWLSAGGGTLTVTAVTPDGLWAVGTAPCEVIDAGTATTNLRTLQDITEGVERVRNAGDSGDVGLDHVELRVGAPEPSLGTEDAVLTIQYETLRYRMYLLKADEMPPVPQPEPKSQHQCRAPIAGFAAALRAVIPSMQGEETDHRSMGVRLTVGQARARPYGDGGASEAADALELTATDRTRISLARIHGAQADPTLPGVMIPEHAANALSRTLPRNVDATDEITIITDGNHIHYRWAGNTLVSPAPPDDFPNMDSYMGAGTAPTATLSRRAWRAHINTASAVVTDTKGVQVGYDLHGNAAVLALHTKKTSGDYGAEGSDELAITAGPGASDSPTEFTLRLDHCNDVLAAKHSEELTMTVVDGPQRTVRVDDSLPATGMAVVHILRDNTRRVPKPNTAG